MPVIRATTGRHLAVEVFVTDTSRAPASLNTLRFTVRDKPGGTTVLDRVMTMATLGDYRVDFTGTETVVLTADASWEVASYDSAVSPPDYSPVASGVLRVSAPGAVSEAGATAISAQIGSQVILIRAGVQGAPGAPGVVAADAPATYDPTSHHVGVAVGTSSGTVAAGNDSRLSDARTPTVHASTHAAGGSDPLTPAAIGAAAASALTAETSRATTAESAAQTAAIAAAATAAASLYVPLTAPGSTIAQLVGGKIPSAQIPSLALVSVVPVANQAAMLALTTTQVQPGDVAVRADGAGSFMLSAADPSVLGNWVLLAAPTDAVTSVNTHNGAVVLTSADIGASFADNGDGTVTLTL